MYYALYTFSVLSAMLIVGQYNLFAVSFLIIYHFEFVQMKFSCIVIILVLCICCDQVEQSMIIRHVICH